MTLTDEQLAQILWDFNTQLNAPQKSDLIFALGSHDIRVARKAAELFHQGYAPLILFSGNAGRMTSGEWSQPEAVLFAAEAIKLGVPQASILIEDRSTNTGENIDFSLQLLKEKGLSPASFLLVQKPYMLQRALATFKKRLPDTPVSLACSDLTFESYLTEIFTIEMVINLVVGDIQRLKLYVDKGFQAPVVIPDEVWGAYEELVKRGYTRHLTV